jgi:hypothetical protein
LKVEALDKRLAPTFPSTAGTAALRSGFRSLQKFARILAIRFTATQSENALIIGVGP